ncbi:PilZ domain-containing protein [Sphingomonas sp. H39-1-10]|uniref:PilZ domain-containing protein n=1 Tax=Sphingomonas TaxID=13687 RepID=UPI00210D52E3|nr:MULTISPECIES: PilZ domain-containing protein [Sphingomonas]MDF0488964.1 PilZ domain-containing protein [Sphingomonas pollutisoli]
MDTETRYLAGPSIFNPAMVMDESSKDPLRGPAGERARDEGAGDRSGARDSLLVMADLRVGDIKTTVRVRNLSAGGLMAEYQQGLEVGTEVEVDLRGVGAVRGRVAWSAAGRIGIAFDRQIDPMLARKPVGTGSKPKTVVAPKYTPRA